MDGLCWKRLRRSLKRRVAPGIGPGAVPQTEEAYMAATPQDQRQILIERGWYVVSEIELAFMRLSGRAHDLLIILKHMQGSNAEAFPGREKLANLMDLSVRSVQNILNELVRKGAVRVRRTGRASRYSATYATATPSELRALMGGGVEIPDELCTSDVQNPCASEVKDSCTSDLYKEPPTKNHLNNSSLREEGDAAASPTTRPREDQMKTHGASFDELDPVAALGRWDSQEAPDSLPDGPEGLFPAREITQPSRSRQTGTRSQARTDSPDGLARWFDAQLRQTDWAGPVPVNLAALRQNLSRWKTGGLTADQIRDMMRRYLEDQSVRKPGVTPWKDFVYKRSKLLNFAQRSAANAAVEENRDASAEHWLGSMAGGQ